MSQCHAFATSNKYIQIDVCEIACAVSHAKHCICSQHICYGAGQQVTVADLAVCRIFLNYGSLFSPETNIFAFYYMFLPDFLLVPFARKPLTTRHRSRPRT